MPFDVFISYSSKDKITANAACAALEAAGVRCWIAPRDIRPGIEYAASIIEGIDACRLMVLIFSSSANVSAQIHREIERAVSKGLTIIPFRIEEVLPTHAMEYYLGAIHWLDALTPPLAKHLQRLSELVTANVDPRSSTPKPFLPPKINRPPKQPFVLQWKLWSVASGLVLLLLGVLGLQVSGLLVRTQPPFPPDTHGTALPFTSCSSQSDCGSGFACVDNNGDRYYFCKPTCQTDAQCRSWLATYPRLRCFDHKNANGTQFSNRVCNDNPSFAR